MTYAGPRKNSYGERVVILRLFSSCCVITSISFHVHHWKQNTQIFFSVDMHLLGISNYITDSFYASSWIHKNTIHTISKVLSAFQMTLLMTNYPIKRTSLEMKKWRQLLKLQFLPTVSKIVKLLRMKVFN